MQREDDRDRAIDRALRQSIAPSEALDSARAESRGHVDGETLAAWSEGRLHPDASARIEQHMSDCARCQQLLTAFARTAPPPAITPPLWRRWHLQWLVPIATAATVAAIWVAMPRNEPTRALAPLADRHTSTSAEPAAPRSTTPPPRPEEPSTRSESLPRSPAETQNQAPQSVAKSTALPSTAKREEFERRDAQDQLAARQAEAAAQVQSPPAVGQAGTREKENDRPPALQETITLVPAPAAPTLPAAAPAAAAGATAPPPARRGAAADARLLTERAFTAPAEIRSPNAAIRWRILNGGRQVERTTNGGAQWEATTLSSAAVLITGISPSSSICWIVGRGGAVYVTTDGLRFVRLMFPESIDLVSVTATDDRHATVMSADGRSFRTDDGGMTWTR